MAIKEMKAPLKMFLSTLMIQGMDFFHGQLKNEIVPKILTEPFLSYRAAFSI